MKKPKISFCTYTCNDAQYAADLLRRTREWTVRPDEYVVVDDGSEQAFFMEDAPDNLTVIRISPNRGITFAKRTGLSAASGDVIFSMDCDTRVAPDWLELNLRYLGDPEIGLVGGALEYRSGDDLVSRYLAKFGDNHNLHEVGPVDFIPGNAFLLRRETWINVGGFGEYLETNCQDHVLSNRIADAGLTLFSDARARAWQLRRISRTTMCKRVWKWCHRTVKEQMLPGDRAIPYLFEATAKPMLDRFEDAITAREPLFLYLELLYLAHTVLDLIGYAEGRDLMPRASEQGFKAGLAELFRGFPAIGARFRDDLAELGHAVPLEPAGPLGPWEDFFLFVPMLRDGGLMEWLDSDGLGLLVQEDRETEYDFSSYATASFDMPI